METCSSIRQSIRRRARVVAPVGNRQSRGAEMISASNEPTCSYELRASFLEVYGNDAFDLLEKAPDKGAKRQTLRLKEYKGQVFVEGLKEVELPGSSRSDPPSGRWLCRATCTHRSARTGGGARGGAAALTPRLANAVGSDSSCTSSCRTRVCVSLQTPRECLSQLCVASTQLKPHK